MNEKYFVIPAGFGLVARASWASTHAEYENRLVYFAPAGSILPNGNMIQAGERVVLKSIWYNPEEGEIVEAFFKNKNNTRNWIKAWDAYD